MWQTPAEGVRGTREIPFFNIGAVSDVKGFSGLDKVNEVVFKS